MQRIQIIVVINTWRVNTLQVFFIFLLRQRLLPGRCFGQGRCVIPERIQTDATSSALLQSHGETLLGIKLQKK